jgi:hypothetical protein
MAIVSSPINRPTKRPEPGLSPGAKSLKNRFATDSVPEPKQTVGDGRFGGSRPGGIRRPGGDERTDSVDGAVAQHLMRHAMLRGPR